MKIYDVLYDCEECQITEALFDGSQFPTEREYNLAMDYLDVIDPTDYITTIGILNKNNDIYVESFNGYEFVIRNETGELEQINESIMQYKRVGDRVKKRYRCAAGPKQGKLVVTPGDCAFRKDPKKVRQGRKIMRAKKKLIQRKSQITKRRQISKLIAKMNKRLSGK